jgi:hypothetical protein
MNIKPDDKLAYIVAPFVEGGRRHFVTIERRAADHETFGNCHFFTTYPSWVCHGAVPDDEGKILTTLVIADVCLRPIRDQPGNEDFVVKARNTLPRAKPVTGPVTINERGEAA